MTFLPVVERELRVASRRRNTYGTRFLAALLAIGVCTWIWFTVSDRGPRSELPKLLFHSLAGMALIFSLMSGLGAADCLSEEKREGTLGLLFLTDLKGYDVVLGKLAATSINSFYRLLAVVPVMAIPLLFGGLTYGEFWRVVLVLSNTMFFSLSAGVLVSALSYHERKALGLTFGLILLVAAGPPIFGSIWSARNSSQTNLALFLPSPGFAFAMAFDQTFATSSRYFWSSVLMTQVSAWGFLALASMLVRRVWQDRPAVGRAAVWREQWRDLKYGMPEVRQSFRTRLLEINPFFWLAGRDRFRPVLVYAFLALAALLWLCLALKYRSEMLDPASYIPTAIILHTIIKIWLASEACRPLAEDRRTGALELVLSTPRSVDEIITGQLLALKRQFAGPVAIILLADLAMFLHGTRSHFSESPNDWLMIAVIGVATFIADLITLAWVGMWLGLTSKKANWASAGALLRVIVLPCVLFLGFLTATVFMNIGRMTDPGNMISGVWFLIALFNDLFFFLWARTNLRQAFRTAAAQRFQIKTTGQWFGSSSPTVPAAGQAMQT